MFEKTKKLMNDTAMMLQQSPKQSKALIAGSTILSGVTTFAYRVLADDAEEVATNKVLGQVIGIITTIAFAVGIMLLVVGIFQIILAFKNDNPDQKHTAMTLAIIGAVLLGLKPTLRGLLNALGQSEIASEI